MYVFYNKTTGRISAWGSSDTPRPDLVDHDMIELPDNSSMNTRLQRIVDGKLVDVEDVLAWNVPTEMEMAARIATELQATDQFMMPDRDVPNRYEWIRYRQALRDLSNLRSVKEQQSAWPERPLLRKR